MVKVYKSEKGRELLHQSYDKLIGLWGVPVGQKDIATRYGATHVITAGDPANPPLVLFHGVGDDSALMWIYNAATLAEHFRLYAVDTIGGPGKSVPNENYDKTFQQLFWIDDILDGLELKQVYVAGTSNGSWLSQLTAARRPERVFRNVCMAGALAVGKPAYMLRMMRVFLPEALFPTKGNVVKLLRKLSGTNIAAFVDNAALMEHWEYLLKYFNNMAMGFHKVVPLTPKEVENVRERTLFLIGDRDVLSYSPESIAILEQTGMNFKVVEGAGHGINHEQAERINREIIGHLLG